MVCIYYLKVAIHFVATECGIFGKRTRKECNNNVLTTNLLCCINILLFQTWWVCHFLMVTWYPWALILPRQWCASEVLIKLVTLLQIFSMANFFDSGILNFLVPVCDSTLTLSFRNTLQEWERVILCRRLGRYKLSSFAHTSWREGRTYLEARTKGGSHSSWAHGRQQQGMVWPERVIGVPLWNAVWWKRRSYLMF